LDVKPKKYLVDEKLMKLVADFAKALSETPKLKTNSPTGQKFLL